MSTTPFDFDKISRNRSPISPAELQDMLSYMANEKFANSPISKLRMLEIESYAQALANDLRDLGAFGFPAKIKAFFVDGEISVRVGGKK